MEQRQPGLLSLVIKTIAAHTTTYFMMGILASSLLNYAEVFTRPEMMCWFRKLTDPIVMAGPLFQPFRGAIFALAFYPLREVLFARNSGWLIMWWVLVALGILATFGPPPGSIEGMVFTVIPISDQIVGWFEVVPQALLFSVILYYWVNNPEKKWLNWVIGALLVITLLLPTLGLLMRP